MQSLCIFCGSSVGFDPVYAEMTWNIGRTLAGRGIRIVYGAGNVGLMGILADAALAAGGQVTGVIPTFLQKKEVYHTGLTELILTDTMHERKQIMAGRSDGFLVLPGGFGSLDEFFEILTWKQLGLHAKPIGIFNMMKFYDPLIAYLEHLEREGFVRESNLRLFQTAASLDELLVKMTLPALPQEEKWL